MSQTVRIDWQYILSRVCGSVRPRKKNYTRKTYNISGKSGRQCVCLIEWPSYRPWMPAEQAKMGVNSVPLRRHRPIEPERRRRWVCVRAHVCPCLCARVCALLMIIIKIIILYFIQIRHTDDFPSTGTRIVQHKHWYLDFCIKPQSHQAYDHVTTYLRPEQGPIVERTYDWSQRSYDRSQMSWVFARGKSVATRSLAMFKTGRATLRPVVPPIDCSLTL